MSTEAEVVWGEALNIIKDDILRENNNDKAYQLWLKPIKPGELDGDNGELTLYVANTFSKKWVEDRYYARISNAIQTVTGAPFEITIDIDSSLAPDPIEEPTPRLDDVRRSNAENNFEPSFTGNIRDNSLHHPNPLHTSTQGFIPQDPASPLQKTRSLNHPAVLDSEITVDQLEKYTFNNFIVAESNEFARTAAMAVAERPGQVYNPLFIYGNSGLGKTHLLGAVYNYVNENFPNKRILFTAASNFVEDFVSYTREMGENKSSSSFESKYNRIDVLIIDDLQDFEGKSGSEEAFYNIFNALVRSGKHIIMAADRPPRDLKMDERYTSRFKQGLEADIHPPTYETKLAILRSYTQYCGGEIDDSVLMYLAEISTSNIREMEGAINRLLAWKSLKPHTVIDVETAREVLKDLFPDKSRRIISVDEIQREVCRYYPITKVELIGNKRSRNIVFPRQVAMYLSRTLTDLSLPKIGEKFGGRDHTTVMHAENKIKKEMNANKEVFDQVQTLIETIKQGG